MDRPACICQVILWDENICEGTVSVGKNLITAVLLFNGCMLCVLHHSIHESRKQSAESANGCGSCAVLCCSEGIHSSGT